MTTPIYQPQPVYSTGWVADMEKKVTIDCLLEDALQNHQMYEIEQWISFFDQFLKLVPITADFEHKEQFMQLLSAFIDKNFSLTKTQLRQLFFILKTLPVNKEIGEWVSNQASRLLDEEKDIKVVDLLFPVTSKQLNLKYADFSLIDLIAIYRPESATLNKLLALFHEQIANYSAQELLTFFSTIHDHCFQNVSIGSLLKITVLDLLIRTGYTNFIIFKCIQRIAVDNQYRQLPNKIRISFGKTCLNHCKQNPEFLFNVLLSIVISLTPELESMEKNDREGAADLCEELEKMFRIEGNRND